MDRHAVDLVVGKGPRGRQLIAVSDYGELLVRSYSHKVDGDKRKIFQTASPHMTTRHSCSNIYPVCITINVSLQCRDDILLRMLVMQIIISFTIKRDSHAIL